MEGKVSPNFTAMVDNGALVGEDTVEQLSLTFTYGVKTTDPIGSYDVTVDSGNNNYVVNPETATQKS